MATSSPAQSPAQLWALHNPKHVRANALSRLTVDEALALKHDWKWWARPDQLAPQGSWSTWLAQCGRGWGKTRCGAEWINEQARTPGLRIALIGRTTADVRDVMIRGESGILAVAHPNHRPIYQPSKRLLTWPNGTIAMTYSAEKPDMLRGPQHHKAWADELAAWKYVDTWNQLQYGLRLGENPQSIVTTTPRPTALVRSLAADPSTHVTRGSTYDNKANLARKFLQEIAKQFEGTRMGRQELYGDLLTDTPGALWTYANLDHYRVRPVLIDDPTGYEGKRLTTQLPHLVRIVVAVDPNVAADTKEFEKQTRAGKGADGKERRGDECGIVVVGLGADGHAYVLQDSTTSAGPAEWAQIVVRLYDQYKANSIVAEANNGGDLIRTTIEAFCRDRKDRDGRRLMMPAIRLVHASKGKRARAEPIATHYEAGRVHHVGTFAELEDEMCTWDATTAVKSPNRIDALVWGATELLEGGIPIHASSHVEENFDDQGFGH